MAATVDSSSYHNEKAAIQKGAYGDDDDAWKQGGLKSSGRRNRDRDKGYGAPGKGEEDGEDAAHRRLRSVCTHIDARQDEESGVTRG